MTLGSQQIMATYEAVLGLTGQMLNAAKRSDWDHLIELESDCHSLIAKLMAADKQSLAHDDNARKVEIIRKVLADDAEIRNITQPWIAELGKFLGHTSNEKKLRRAYDDLE